jgi:hypothetical protein
MTPLLTQLCSQLGALRDEAGPLADRLDAAAERLERGFIPSGELLLELQRFAEHLEALGERVGLSRDRWHNHTWFDWEQRCLERDRRDAILSLLKALSRLRHAAQPDFAPLQELLSEVAAVRQALESGREVDAALLEALWQGDHVWSDLLRLVSAGAEISDDVWEALQERVSRDLGRPLAIAVARGQIVLSPEGGPKEGPWNVASASPSPLSPGVMRLGEAASADEASPDITPQAIVTKTVAASSARRAEASADRAIEAGPAAQESSSSETGNEAKAPTVVATPPDVPDGLAHSVFDEIELGTSERRQLALLQWPLPSDRCDGEPAAQAAGEASSARAPLDHRSCVLIEEVPEQASGNVTDEAAPAGASTAATAVEYGPEFFATEPQEPALQSAARSILDTPPPLPEVPLAELVWWLVFEGQGGLAWHLSRALERLPAGVPLLPPALVEAWVCAAAVQFPQGRLAAALTAALSRCDPAAWERHPEEFRRAARLLLHASALRPALVCPETKAGAILRSFPLEAGTTQLYNYSQRVAAVGDQCHGRVLGQAGLAARPADRSRPLMLLHEEIRRWQGEANGGAPRFERTEPLFQHAFWSVRSGPFQRQTDLVLTFSKWMHVLRLTEELLGPVLADDSSAAAEVHALAARITANVVVGRPGDFPAGSKAIIVPEPAMQRRLLDAVAFAQRWLALLEPATGASPVPLSPAVESLRREIQERQDDVLAELHQLASGARSLELQTAASCLMLAVEQVRESLDPSSPPPLEEPLLPVLLSSELLRIPEVRLDADWFPTCPPAEFIERLLNSLAAPRPTWATAYRLQAERGDDRATERILSLPVWSWEQRQTLSAQREERVAAVRRELRGELDAIVHTLDTACQQGTLAPEDRAGFDAGIAALRRKIERSAVWSVPRGEVAELRRRLQDRGIVVPSSAQPPGNPGSHTTTPCDGSRPPNASVLYDPRERFP